eukprot:GHVU01017103.1.p4 GENE.GHVU01017103.1~~GHVU01017103.1.p4  ORF type:complete len:106 (+),score=6.83 GHVU01017103.1:408-725(+)
MRCCTEQTGETFDPTKHEALFEVDDPSKVGWGPMQWGREHCVYTLVYRHAHTPQTRAYPTHTSPQPPRAHVGPWLHVALAVPIGPLRVCRSVGLADCRASPHMPM